MTKAAWVQGGRKVGERVRALVRPEHTKVREGSYPSQERVELDDAATREVIRAAPQHLIDEVRGDLGQRP
jgi:hypothetical protein